MTIHLLTEEMEPPMTEDTPTKPPSPLSSKLDRALALVPSMVQVIVAVMMVWCVWTLDGASHRFNPDPRQESDRARVVDEARKRVVESQREVIAQQEVSNAKLREAIKLVEELQAKLKGNSQ